jgi:glycosyltransferase involved in cell wall biosynthesis
MLSDLGIASETIRILPNGIDTHRFFPGKKSRSNSLLLFVGRIDPAKGLTVLMGALNYLTTKCRVLIVGPVTNLEYYEEIVRLATKINDKGIHHVEFAGEQAPQEIVKWYQGATIFVLPSLSESFPLTLLEAMACETAVVATNVGGIPTMIQDHRNGIIVPPKDPKRLAQAIQYLLDNQTTRKKFGKEGRRVVVEQFSSEAVAKRLVQMYRDIAFQEGYSNERTKD